MKTPYIGNEGPNIGDRGRKKSKKRRLDVELEVSDVPLGRVSGKDKGNQKCFRVLRSEESISRNRFRLTSFY